MKHILGPEGKSALQLAMSRRTLIALDFDGTIAPIASRPQDARVPDDIAGTLRLLVRRCPVAVISGRSVDDVVPRLAFSPHYIVGNHGAEDGGSAKAVSTAALNAVRAHIAAHGNTIAQAGITVEDKGLSLALHYRHAADQAAALKCIDELRLGLVPGVRSFGGKCVINVVPTGAPDKADALHTLVKQSSAQTAVFIGDDVNDEPIFERASVDWVTVRVGRDDPDTHARYFLEDQAEIDTLLQLLLKLLPASRRR
jgi:trehalose 6-phosphate phosphatase